MMEQFNHRPHGLSLMSYFVHDERLRLVTFN